MSYVHNSPATDHRRQPRKKRAPNARDQQILVEYRTQGRTQAAIADDNGISQRRVSEIVRRVERWRANLIPKQENQLDYEEQQRLDRCLARERSQALFDRGLRGFDQAPKTLTTKRKGQRDGKPFEEETIREVAPSPQFLRLATQASRELSRLSDQPPPPRAEVSQQQDWSQQFWEVKKFLYQLREKAEQAGKVIADSNTFSNEVMVDILIDALVGKPICPYYVVRPGSALHQLLTLLTPGQEVQSPTSGHPQSGSIQSQDDAASTLDSGLGTQDSAPTLDSGPETLDSSPTLDLGPGTLDSTVSNNSNPVTTQSPQPLSPAEIRRELRRRLGHGQSKTPAAAGAPKPAAAGAPKSDFQERYRRRQEHMEKLKRIREAQANNHPYCEFLDPADGPIPRDEYKVDGCGWKPTPPNKEDEAAQLKDYLAQLRAEQEANRQSMQPFYDTLPYKQPG
jgi:hypothetical protein